MQRAQQKKTAHNTKQTTSTYAPKKKPPIPITQIPPPPAFWRSPTRIKALKHTSGAFLCPGLCFCALLLPAACCAPPHPTPHHSLPRFFIYFVVQHRKVLVCLSRFRVSNTPSVPLYIIIAWAPFLLLSKSRLLRLAPPYIIIRSPSGTLCYYCTTILEYNTNFSCPHSTFQLSFACTPHHFSICE